MKKYVLILGLIASFNANAEELPSCGENCTYHLENGVLTIEPIDSSKPAGIKNYSYFSGCSGGVWGYCSTAPWAQDLSITKVEITEGITSVGDNAFAYQPSIVEVNLPDGLETIGYQGFHRTSITSIDLPDSLKEIGGWAFVTKTLQQVNGSLENVTKLYNMPFADTALSGFVVPPNITELSANTFSGNNSSYNAKNLTNLYCPESLMSECAAAIAYRGDDAEVKGYAFDGGVYVIGDDYYLSSDDMKKGDTASSAEEKAQYVCAGTLNHCKKQALISRGICQDADCDALVASDGNYMLKYNGKTYQSINDLLKGNYDVRRIYTVEEANFVAGKVNSVKIRYR